MEKFESTFQNSIEKSYLSLSYISSEKFIERISMCLDLLLKTDLLDTNKKMDKILEELSVISSMNEERSNLLELFENISLNTNKISQNQLVSSDNLTHFSTLLNNLSSMQSDHFNLLLTKSFFDSWNGSFQDYFSNNFQEINKIITTNFQNIEFTHISFAENIFTLLNNIPSLEVINPFLVLIEDLSFSLPHIKNLLSAEQFMNWSNSISFLTIDQFNSYNTKFESTLINQYNATTLTLSNIFVKIADLENFEATWSFWSNTLDNKIDLLSSEQS
jgi:hypothetical protein